MKLFPKWINVLFGVACVGLAYHSSTQGETSWVVIYMVLAILQYHLYSLKKNLEDKKDDK